MNAAVYVSCLRTHACIFFENRNGEKLVFPYLLVCFVLAASAGFPFRLSLKENTAAKTLTFALGNQLCSLSNRKTRTETHRSLFVSNPKNLQNVCVRESFLAPWMCVQD